MRPHLYKRPCPSVRPSVGWLVGWSVGRSVTLESKSGKTRISAPAHPSATGIGRVSGLVSLTSLLLPKWSGDLKYGPCPPARDFGSRVSGLVPILVLVGIHF